MAVTPISAEELARLEVVIGEIERVTSKVCDDPRSYSRDDLCFFLGRTEGYLAGFRFLKPLFVAAEAAEVHERLVESNMRFAAVVLAQLETRS